MSKQDASVKTTFNLLNVKLRMPEAKEASQDDYVGLITQLASRRIRATVTQNIGVIMKRCIIERIGDNIMLYGIITRYTPLTSGKLLNLEEPDQSEEDQEGLPINRVPNPKDVAFFFSPSNHRLAISKRGGPLSIKQAHDYFVKAFKQILKTGQLVDVDIEQDGDTFREILDAPRIKRVRIEVSYTNNDMSKENAADLDQKMKSGNVGRFVIEAISDGATEGLDVAKIPFLQGAFELAQSNGKVSATVIDAKSPTKRGRTVETEEHPREESVVSEKPGDVVRDMYAKLKNLFPRG
ncbi:DUF4747 family protein [Hymenobacter negativus]|uniref:DUF4747 family protein n=1 Tax=Hymenobacter negativus TaxID=2795026 RepID=A0ABS3QDR9_9BACT|nr:DUF4747 family protein [Hymenobacter negativus]MBO2009153.1 DUF4747 family protein [Hymenobacter negativus]